MEIEYTQRVKMADGWSPEALRGLVEGACRIVMVAHTSADGDAVGSLTGLYAVLHAITSATLTPMLPDGCPDDLLWLPNTGAILDGKRDTGRCRQAIAEADLVVALDMSTLGRTDLLEPFFRQSRAHRVLIDHHIGPERECFDVVVSDPDISSTCELVFWTMRMLYGNDCFSPEAAKSLYAGICTDTGTFSYSNRQASLYLAAAELSQMGIDPMEVNREIKNVFTVNRLRFFGYAMNNLLEVYPGQGVALIVLWQRDMERYGVRSEDITGLVNEVMKLRDIDCAVLIRQEDKRVRLSLRSKTRYDVNLLARQLFDGGGHERAAGATSLLTVGETVDKVKEALHLE